MNHDFVGAFREMERECHMIAEANGFWDYSSKTPVKTVIAEKLALCHSELSEGLEAIRETTGGFGNLDEELADTIIRIMDLSARFRLRVGEALIAKVEKNRGRPFRHGKEL